MLAIRRKAFQSSVRLSAARQTCRYSTGKDSHDAHHSSESSHDHHGEHHSGPKDEALGTQLYVALAVLPFCYGTYLISRPGADGTNSVTTRITDAYLSYRQTWEDRNKLHADTVELAGHDRALFMHSQGSNHIDLRFPEVFNTGSPFNVVAGQGAANLDTLVAHYEKANVDADEKKTKALQARAAVASKKD